MAEKLSKVIRDRGPHLITNLIFLLVTWVVATIISPLVTSLGTQLNLYGLSIGAGTLVLIIFVAIIIYLAVGIVQDAMKLVETLSIVLIGMAPWIEEKRKPSMTRALKEIVVGIILIFLTPIAALPSTLLGSVGSYLTAFLQIVLVLGTVILFFDAGRILYSFVEEVSESVTEKVALQADKLVKKTKKSKKSKKSKK